MVFGQCQIDLVAELPAEAPPGFAELRREILGFVGEGEEGMLQVAGMQAGEKGGIRRVGCLWLLQTRGSIHGKGLLCGR
jgi:hypothetical protein